MSAHRELQGAGTVYGTAVGTDALKATTLTVRREERAGVVTCRP